MSKHKLPSSDHFCFKIPIEFKICSSMWNTVAAKMLLDSSRIINNRYLKWCPINLNRVVILSWVILKETSKLSEQIAL